MTYTLAATTLLFLWLWNKSRQRLYDAELECLRLQAALEKANEPALRVEWHDFDPTETQ
jgi:hypothetical protein